MCPVALGMPTVRHRARSTVGRPETPFLVDRFGRTARDLRVSITSACSLRCTYCMPAEGLPIVPRGELLTPEEIARLVTIAVHDLGVREVRFTGGEPLTRPDLVEIVRQTTTAVPGLPVSMTTNGIGLDRKAPQDAKDYALKKAPERFAYLDAHLAGRAFLLDSFSVADAYLATVLNWTQAVPQLDLSAYANMQDYLARMRMRPSIAKVLGIEVPLFQAEMARRKAA